MLDISDQDYRVASLINYIEEIKITGCTHIEMRLKR